MNVSNPNSQPSGVQAYGDSFADVYDEWYHDVTDAEACADFVADHAGAGPVLELGVGTGRLARPLLARGLTVVGLDASTAMLDGCLALGRDSALALVQADMAALPFRGSFGVALIAFNTLFNLPTADLQRTLFREVAPLLAKDGALVVEAMNTSSLGTGPRRSVAPSRNHLDGVTVVATNLDPDEQTILGQHIEVRSSGIRRRPWLLRWSTVDEIDGYATEAGLQMGSRYGGWERQPHTGDDETHITVYRRSAAD